MEIKNIKDVSSLLKDIDSFVNNPDFSPENQNKWFFSNGLSYYEQLCEILKTLTYFSESFENVYENEKALADAYDGITVDVSTIKEQISDITVKVEDELNRIITLENDNVTNKTNIANLQGDNTTNKADIATLKADNTINKSDITNLKTDNSTNKANIAILQSDNTENKKDISTLKTDNETNKTNISLLQDDNELNKGKIALLESDNTTNKADIANLKSDNTTNKANITALQTDNATNKTNITALQTDNTTNKADIATLKSDNNINKSDIASLKTDNTTNKADIANLKTDNTTNKANIATNTADIKAINDKDFLQLVKILDSSNITVKDMGKTDSVQTFQLTVTGSTPSNLTENLTFFNNNPQQPIISTLSLELDSTNNKVKLSGISFANGEYGSVDTSIQLSTDEFKIVDGKLTLAKTYATQDNVEKELEDLTTTFNEALATKQNTLTSGTNIKTINGNSVLGSGNIVTPDTTYNEATTSASGLMSASDKTKLNGIASGATKVTVDSALSTSSTNPVQNKVINSALDGKQPTLISGSNIKTINSNSILGSGNVDIQSLPSGGVKNNLLYKKSDTDYDVGWSGITTDNILTQDNIVNNLTSASTTNVLGAGQGKALKTLIDAKQDTLVSASNIKTINGNSILGSGDLEITSSINIETSNSPEVIGKLNGYDIYRAYIITVINSQTSVSDVDFYNVFGDIGDSLIPYKLELSCYPGGVNGEIIPVPFSYGTNSYLTPYFYSGQLKFIASISSYVSSSLAYVSGFIYAVHYLALQPTI